MIWSCVPLISSTYESGIIFPDSNSISQTAVKPTLAVCSVTYSFYADRSNDNVGDEKLRIDVY